MHIAEHEKRKKCGRLIIGLVCLFLLLLVFSVSMLYCNRRFFSTLIAGKVLSDFEVDRYVTVCEQLHSYTCKGDQVYTMAKTVAPEYYALEGSTFPAKLDLRNVDGKNYVTSVKNQGAFHSGWTFGILAAAETTLLTQLDLPVKDQKDPVDLSERYLGWFSYTPVKDGNQDQEGRMVANDDFSGYSSDSQDIFDQGEAPVTIATMMKSGFGMINESMIPYCPEEMNSIDKAYLEELCAGKDLNDDAVKAELRNDLVFAAAEPYLVYTSDGKPGGWNSEGNWGVKGNLQFQQGLSIKETRTLPLPRFGDPVGVNAMKKEISEGRAVILSFYADPGFSSQMPGDTENGSSYMARNEDGSWAQYTYEEVISNHTACVIGWDDTFPASQFHANAALCPPGDGAWIVKDSRGSVDSSFPHYSGAGGWGTNGTGYFYLSYYDCSISAAETLSFEIDDLGREEADIIVNEHDFMTGCESASLTMPGIIRAASANVFRVDYYERLHHIGVDVAAEEPTEVTAYIYRLRKNYQSPTDGELLDTVVFHTEYPGFYRIPLNESQSFHQKDLYSIVVEESGNDAGTVTIHFGRSLEGTSVFRNIFLEEGGNPELSIMKSYYNGIVNEGESFLKIGDVWMDLTTVIEESEQMFPDGANGSDVIASSEFLKGYTWKASAYCIDNFPIKGYASPLL